MITDKRTIIKIDSSNLDGDVFFNISAERQICKATITVTKNDYSNCVIKEFDSENEVKILIKIDNPLIWSVNEPNLYSYKIDIKYNDGEESALGKFGIRNIATNGKYVLLNDKPIFLRGYVRGHKCHDHSNTCNLSESEFYRKNIRQSKKFGFNFVRFHSTIPSETFLNVADEEGLLVHIELRDPEFEYNNQEEMLAARKEFVSNEFIYKTINTNYNHPSLMVYCIGNEIKWLDDYSRVEEISRIIKEADSSRLFIDTCAWGANNRKYVDIDVQHMSYYFPYGKHSDMYENTENLLVCGSADGSSVKENGVNSVITRELSYNVPLIAHEATHYVALNDYKKLKEKFAKYNSVEPWWIDEELKMIKEKGFEKSYEEMFYSSKYFQFECWKTAYEKMRLSKLLAGFHCLQFADTDVYENSNGIVDCFDDENYVRAEEFRKFNDDIIVLADLNARTFKIDEEICVPIYISNFDNLFENCSVEFKMETSNEVLASGKIKGVNIDRFGNYRICTIRIKLQFNLRSSKAVLSIMLKNKNNIVCENEWTIWLYEKQSNYSYKEFCNYDNDNVVITNNFDKALNSLCAGKKTCLIYRSAWTRHLLNQEMLKPKYAFKATWNRFKPVIWDRGTNCGGVCDDVILNKYGFSTGKYYDFNYYPITEDCDKIILDDFPVKVKSIISGNDKCVRDRFDVYKKYFNLPELQYDRTLRNFSYLFELKVGEGCLLVCGLNMTGLDSGDVTTNAIANFIIKYIASNDFNPNSHIEENEFVSYITNCAKEPIKERMMTQFWELDDSPVESQKYWIDSKKYLE